VPHEQISQHLLHLSGIVSNYLEFEDQRAQSGGDEM
jgi:hypothetical protein